jgi:hypothetical protein
MFKQRLLYAVLTSTLYLLFHTNGSAQSEDRSKTIKEISSLRKELDEKEKLLLAPSDKDLASFAEFLKQPKTGLIRLFPRDLYENRLTIRGGGSSYSFTRSSHEYGSEIELNRARNDMGLDRTRNDIGLASTRNDIGFDRTRDNIERVWDPNNNALAPLLAGYEFRIGLAGADFGFITMLGKVPLEKVTLDHNAAKFLVDYIPPSIEQKARAEYRRARDGFKKAGFTYKTTIQAHPDYAYLLRLISYRNSDILVAFRVVRRDSDGSLVILWKILKEFPRPELIPSTSK